MYSVRLGNFGYDQILVSRTAVARQIPLLEENAFVTMTACAVAILRRYTLHIVTGRHLEAGNVLKVQQQILAKVRQHVGVGRHVPQGYVCPRMPFRRIGIEPDLELHAAADTGTAIGTNVTAGTVVHRQRMTDLAAHGVRIMDAVGVDGRVLCIDISVAVITAGQCLQVPHACFYLTGSVEVSDVMAVSAVHAGGEVNIGYRTDAIDITDVLTSVASTVTAPTGIVHGWLPDELMVRMQTTAHDARSADMALATRRVTGGAIFLKDVG